MTPNDSKLSPPASFEVASSTSIVRVINNLAAGGAESMLACLATELREELDRSTGCLLDRGWPRWCRTWRI